MNNYRFLLLKELAIHKKIFFLIPYIAVVLLIALKTKFIPSIVLNKLVLELNFFIPMILLFSVKMEENQSSGLNNLLTTSYKRYDLVLSRYHFTLLFTTITFLVNETILILDSVVGKMGENSVSFSLFYLGSCFVSFCVLSAILLLPNFVFNLPQFAILATVISTIFSQMFSFLIGRYFIQHSFLDFFLFLVEIFLSSGVILLFLRITNTLFKKKDL